MPRDHHNAPRFLGRWLAGISVLLGMGVLAVVGYECYYAQASSNWPGTPGELRAHSEHYEREHQTVTGNQFETTIEWYVYYRYTVAGVQYVGTRISFGRSDREAPNPQTDTQVTVFYNPHSPSQSVLFPGSTGLPWEWIIFGVALVGLGLFIPKIGVQRTRSVDKP